jgi:type I restriction enzyme M protein
MAVRTERVKLKDDLAELETRMAGYLQELGYGS